MRFLLILAGAIILVGVPTLTHRVAKRRVTEGIERVSTWEMLPDAAKREKCIFEYMRSRVRADAMRWQLAASLTLAGLLFGAASFWVIYDVANESHDLTVRMADLATDNCRLYEQFIFDEQSDTSREIDVLTAEIVDLQAAIDETPGEIEQAPGYAEAPDWFQEFLSGLLAADIEEANGEIEELRARRTALEQREIELEGLLETADCPRAE